jgi:cytochrome c-type protein NapC
VRITALVLAGVAAIMLIAYLVRRPALSPAVRLWLLAAVGLLPLGAALTGNLSGYQVTTQRSFCGSCHVMEPYTRDAADPESNSLAAVHSRNRAFGHQSCHACHRDYGIFGTVTTKLGGLRHAWSYYVGRWEQPIRLYRPYSNDSCRYCHSTTLTGFVEEPEHMAVKDDLARGTVSCAAAGCHGPPHGVASAER